MRPKLYILSNSINKKWLNYITNEFIHIQEAKFEIVVSNVESMHNKSDKDILYHSKIEVKGNHKTHEINRCRKRTQLPKPILRHIANHRKRQDGNHRTSKPHQGLVEYGFDIEHFVANNIERQSAHQKESCESADRKNIDPIAR